MSSNEIIILIFGVIIIVAFWPEAGSIRRRAAEPVHHPGLVTYLVVVMVIVKQPWNFWLIFIGVIWAFRSSNWVRRWKFGPPLENSPLGEWDASRHQKPANSRRKF
jgi:hypothetical protein